MYEILGHLLYYVKYEVTQISVQIHKSKFLQAADSLQALCITLDKRSIQGPVVQSLVSLTSLLVDKLLTVLVSTISNSQVFLLKKCE